MGSFFSTSTTHSIDISGTRVNLWIINGVMFDMSSMFNETLRNAAEEFQKIVVASNRRLIINIMLILTIFMIIILLLFFIHLRCYYQQIRPKINHNNHLISNSIECSTSSNKPLSKYESSYAEGYLV